VGKPPSVFAVDANCKILNWDLCFASTRVLR
jgi:hypothetical protein